LAVIPAALIADDKDITGSGFLLVPRGVERYDICGLLVNRPSKTFIRVFLIGVWVESKEIGLMVLARGDRIWGVLRPDERS